jgi:ABC-type bacteriocin/lantibiotic exporter with double-glycine peptidase domain
MDLDIHQIKQKLQSIGLSDFINTFPEKLNTVVGKEGSKVSGGQRQFIAMLRSIIQNKKIILLDEPSSSLDEKTKKLMMTLIKNLKNRTIIISTHDKQLLSLFDIVVDITKIKSNVNDKSNNKLNNKLNDKLNENPNAIYLSDKSNDTDSTDTDD